MVGEKSRERGIVQTVHSIIYFFLCFKKQVKYVDKCATSFQVHQHTRLQHYNVLPSYNAFSFSHLLYIIYFQSFFFPIRSNNRCQLFRNKDMRQNQKNKHNSLCVHLFLNFLPPPPTTGPLCSEPHINQFFCIKDA